MAPAGLQMQFFGMLAAPSAPKTSRTHCELAPVCGQSLGNVIFVGQYLGNPAHPKMEKKKKKTAHSVKIRTRHRCDGILAMKQGRELAAVMGEEFTLRE